MERHSDFLERSSRPPIALEVSNLKRHSNSVESAAKSLSGFFRQRPPGNEI